MPRKTESPDQVGHASQASQASQTARSEIRRRRPPCRDFGGDPRSVELAASIVERGRALAAQQRELLGDIAEFDRAEAWRGDGAVSMVSWLTERTGVGGATARMWVRTAAHLETLPHLAGSLADGSISLDQLAPLAEVATPESDARLAMASRHWSARQAREMAASHRGSTDAADARRHEHRSLRFNDTNCTLWAALTKDDYAEVKAALVAGVSLERADDGAARSEADGVADPLGYVPFEQRLYDSLMNMVRGARMAAKGTRYRPTVVVHADLGMLTGSKSDGECEIQGIGPISREVARRLACDAQVVFSVEGRDGCILDQKRARRSPTVAQRREIARRDKGCRFPGCSFTNFTQVHHVVLWTSGGETNQSNLITLCGRHHSAVHELGWSMHGDPDGVVTFNSPHGHAMTSSPSPTWRMGAQRAKDSSKGLPLRR
ncbi:MAG TPA: HNH endonuclease [Acidimicrobiales bacterium]